MALRVINQLNQKVKKMTSNNISSKSLSKASNINMEIVLYGFDLFFENSDEMQLQKICNSLGKGATFDVAEGVVNYEMRNRQIHKLKRMSKAVDIIYCVGEHLAEKHGAILISVCLNSAH